MDRDNLIHETQNLWRELFNLIEQLSIENNPDFNDALNNLVEACDSINAAIKSLDF